MIKNEQLLFKTMYKEILLENVNFNNNNLLLLVTATILETQQLHNELKPYDNYKALLQIHKGDSTYYIGIFGNYLAVHVQCGTMGSLSRDSSITTIIDAISLFNPKITLMIGVAFGVDNNEQNIGDVLVSECITPYNFKKVQNGIDIIRANDAPASKLLLNRFKSALSWEFLLKDNIKAKMILAPVFSGEELINDIERRAELINKKPTAKGGEMEGAGLYSAADGKCEWILVKGICDFADGNKDKDKEANQILAIQSALSLCKEVFLSQTAFESIGLKPLQVTEIDNLFSNPQNINQVLFDRYDSTKEKYYLTRVIDKTIIENLKLYSIWVFGKSGRGKSNVLLRNIVNEKLDHIIISLANCVGLSIDDFFKEIFIELSEKLEPQVMTLGNVYFQQSIKDIISLLERHFANKEVYIIIDEIPIGNDENCKVFTDRICSLFISNSLYSNCTKIKYVLSSIYSPINHISDFNQRIFEIVKFVEINDWENHECNNLITIIQENLDLSIDSKIKDEIVNSSNGSPRFIKKTFKNSFALGGLNFTNYQNVIAETKRELNKN
jgi:nucleoside phosphorylase